MNVGIDLNDNETVDIWEMLLAQKFCPVLFQPIDDNGSLFGVPGENYTLRPVPVEAMDFDGDGILSANDVYVEVYHKYTEQFVGEWKMDELIIAGSPYSNRYPDLVKPADDFNFQPPGKAFGPYVLFTHYEWATIDNNEGNGSWYQRWNDLFFEEAIQNSNIWYLQGTIYAFFESSGQNTKIIYPMHYPFNASANRHEGDWPSIVVELDSQKPDEANIISVFYPFHGVGTFRTIAATFSTSAAEALYQEQFFDDGNDNPIFANKYFVTDGTHPVTFGGGRISELGLEGWGSHAQYPNPGVWIRTEFVSIEEFVVENGSIANETLLFDFNNYQNIIILPGRQFIVDNFRNDPTFSWTIFGGFWGSTFSYPSVEDAYLSNFWDAFSAILTGWSFGLLYPVLPRIPNTNLAPLSPYGGSLGW